MKKNRKLFLFRKGALTNREICMNVKWRRDWKGMAIKENRDSCILLSRYRFYTIQCR